MDRQAYKHYEWYNAILQQELYAAPCGYKLQVRHWSIESGQEKAFAMNGHQFDVISMITGPSTEHWFGANVTNRFCMHGVFYATKLNVTARYDLTTNDTKNISNDKDYNLKQQRDNSDKLDDNCTDMLLLKATFKQLVCPKRSKKHNFNLITINEE